MSIEPKKIAMDVSSIRDWHGTPVGIVRVVVEVARYAVLHSETYDCQFFCFSKDKQKLIILPREKVVQIMHRMESGKQKRNLFIRAVGKIKRILKINDFPLLFESKEKQSGSFLEGRTVISVGFDWDTSNYPLLIQIKKQFPFRFVSFFHDAIYFFHPEWCPDSKFPSLFQEYYRSLVSLSDLVICNSKYTETEYLEMANRLGIKSPPEIEPVIPGGNAKGLSFSPKKIKKILNKIRISPPYVLYVSTIEPRKNHLLLVKVWDELIRHNCEVPSLIFVGRLRNGCEELFEFLDKNLEVKNKIIFLSQITDNQLVLLYQESLYTVFPSFDEGFGLGASESLQYGKVCIVSSCPALVEATQGLMPCVAVDDFEHWVSINERCISDKTYLHDLEHVITYNFKFRSWEMFSKNFFEKILG